MIKQKIVNWEALGFLRFVLACIVSFGHLTFFSVKPATWTFVAYDLGGKAAVLGFLLVSGYSIAASLESSPVGYFRRRLLRIYPLYITAITVAIIVQLATGGHVEAPRRTFEGGTWISVLGNAVLLQTFVVKTMDYINPVWSLSIEVFFYALAPLLIRLSRQKLVALLLVSLVCFMLPVHTDWGAAYYFLCKFNALRFMWCWLLGFLLWHDRRPLFIIFSIATVGLLLVHETTPEPLSIVTYGIAVGTVAFSRWIALPKYIGEAFTYLGDISYPLYLFHYPVLIYVWAKFGIENSFALALVSIIVSLIAYYIIDRLLKPRYLKPLFISRVTTMLPINL